MAYAINRYTGDGTTTNFVFTFSYLVSSHVLVYVNGALQTETVNYTVSGSTVTFTSAPAASALIVVKRSTSQSSRMTTYEDGITLSRSALETDSKQAFQMAQEALDGQGSGENLPKSYVGNYWDAGSLQIKNLGYPTVTTDAATKSYVDASITTVIGGGSVDLFTNTVSAARNNAGGSTLGAYSTGIPLGYTGTGLMATYVGNYNSYAQVVSHNSSNGNNASSDFTVSTDASTDSSNYGNFGKNSSGWTGVAGTASFNAANMVYLTSTGADLAIGTTSANTLRFSVNSASDFLTVDSTGVYGGTGVTTAATTGGSATALARSGDYGFGRSAWAATTGTNFTTDLNVSAVYRTLSGATGGPTTFSGVVWQAGFDGTPTTIYMAAGGSGSAQRLVVGWKSGAGATPTWREFAPLDTPNFTGNVGMGGTSTTYRLQLAGNATGGVTTGAINIASTVATDSTTNNYGIICVPTTAASTWTLGNHIGFLSGVNAGAGSTITNAMGFRASSLLGTQATNGYGYYGEIASGTNKWNLYMLGTAQNYLAGNLGIGSGKTAPTCALDVNGLVAKSAANSLTALGTNLATALALTAAYNVCTTVGAGTGVALPNVVGAQIWVFNNQATNALLVYPPSGTVNGAASFSLAANAKMIFVQIAAGVWYSLS